MPHILPPYGDRTKPSVAWAIVTVACIVNFLDLFQSSMVMFGLADIKEALEFTDGDLNWILVAYTLTFATILPAGGQLADRVGLRLTFLIGTFMLFWTNILISWTPDRNGLLAGRALAGVGAALTCATGISVISHTFPPGKNRNAGLAIYVSCGPIGTVLGVILGALLTASPAGWRSMFWVNFILAGVACVLGFLIIPNFDRDTTRGFGYYGVATFMAGTCLLIFGLNDAVDLGWKHPAVIVTIIVGALLLIAFPLVERKVNEPAVPLSIMRNPHVLVPLTVFMFVGGGWVTWFFLATEICLNSLHYKTVLAACYFLPATAASMIGGGIGNKLVGMGYTKIVIVAGYVISVGALVPWGFVGPQFGIWYVIVFSIFYLFAAPGIAVAAQAIVLNEIPLEDHGTAGALMNVMYQFGSSLFLAVINVVMGSTARTGDMSHDLLVQYHNGMWTLLAFTATGLILFVVFYLPRESRHAGILEKPQSESDEVKDEEEAVRATKNIMNVL
ncbi:Major facilitator superfamily domaingeneral substrate transporter [Penicillium desertorum]|uniref:Major facilitator superfamily domaingeneral substrate transporter n=1 Tax=Penicillium desertorum TaxID=1303715 RepID=A0A9W9WQ36_9EURO|nr:Major facilitator superfamily domaingeneral substrate transporter [Penicillium desertorum]